MTWQSVTMAKREFTQFRKDLVRMYRDEIAAGRLSGYTLFAHRGGAGAHVLFVPPGAAFLFDRLPSWKTRLRPCEGTPNLRRSEAMPVR